MRGSSGGYNPHAPLAVPVAAPPFREVAASVPGSRPAPAPAREKPEAPRQQTIAPTRLNDRTLPIGAAEVPILSYNTERRYLFMVNIGANDVWISFVPGVAAGRGIKLPANGFYEPLIAPTNEMYAVSPTGSTLTVIEG